MILGIDTSNYTTSAALYDSATESVVQRRKGLPVKFGELGLRQSDALFHHTVQLPALLEDLLAEKPALAAVAVSDKPRSAEGSYMPCFLAGVSVAAGVAAALGVPLRRCSHQEGHLASALYSAGKMDWMRAPFLAFHLSGGTTECLLVPARTLAGWAAECIGGSSDLKAGQVVDRLGVSLGLPFPAGAALDALALQGTLPRRPSPALRGLTCSFSGLENQCAALLAQGCPQADAARYCLECIATALEKMVERIFESHGTLPMLFVGGVACSEVLRQRIRRRYPAAVFAAPAFSADNAVGAAVLAASSY
ncbi:MAG: peptidase M22 [Oscillospiraceae bacterium]|jgi:N6-L-threonylcarbamoyladenine synthase|nr:peptidase M22 [Oscillospiraceae bacterium]